MRKINKEANPEVETDSCERVQKKYIWDEEQVGQYRDSLEAQNEEFRDLTSNLARLTTSQEINENLKQFSDLMSKICDPLFSKKYIFPKTVVIRSIHLSLPNLGLTMIVKGTVTYFIQH